LRIPRRRPPEDGRRPRRSLNALWLLFWLILVIILLGLIFGGYRKGNKESGMPLPTGHAVAAAVWGSADR
jgi:hypothetical protein